MGPGIRDLIRIAIMRNSGENIIKPANEAETSKNRFNNIVNKGFITFLMDVLDVFFNYHCATASINFFAREE